MISIGAQFRGPELDKSLIAQAIRNTMTAVKEARGFGYGEGNAPSVNVVFYVPGSLGDFDITKVEASRLSRKRQVLLVAVPVPKDMVESNKSVEFIIDALSKANAVAAETFARKANQHFDLQRANAIVETVKQALLQ